MNSWLGVLAGCLGTLELRGLGTERLGALLSANNHELGWRAYDSSFSSLV